MTPDKDEFQKKVEQHRGIRVNMYFKIKWIVLALNAVIVQLQLSSVENTVLLKEAADRPLTDKKVRIDRAVL